MLNVFLLIPWSLSALVDIFTSDINTHTHTIQIEMLSMNLMEEDRTQGSKTKEKRHGKYAKLQPRIPDKISQ